MNPTTKMTIDLLEEILIGRQEYWRKQKSEFKYSKEGNSFKLVTNQLYNTLQQLYAEYPE